MKFIIAIEPGTGTTAWGVVVPDLPGCFSAGDSMDEALENAHEAIGLHVQTLIEDGIAIPDPYPLAQHQADPVYAGWMWAVVEVPVEKSVAPVRDDPITVFRGQGRGGATQALLRERTADRSAMHKQDIEAGIVQAERGEFASSAEVTAVFARHGA